jgi:protein-S-isoprenylcysteine O-methyltransferase
MNRRSVACLFLASGIYVAPLAPAWTRLVDRSWIGLVATFVFLLSQPPVPRREWLDADAPDRRSALLIFIAMIGVQVVAVFDFGYGTGPVGAPEHVASRLVPGVALVTGGLTLRLWAIRALGDWFTATVRVVDGQRVVQCGPYRWLRHPSYTGALLVALGVATALGSAWGMASTLLLGVPIYLYRIHVEERSLISALGREYEEYGGRTWRLLPFVY